MVLYYFALSESTVLSQTLKQENELSNLIVIYSNSELVLQRSLLDVAKESPTGTTCIIRVS